VQDFAIAPARSCGQRGWDVLHLLGADEGREVAAPIASFGERCHAEAFLRDLIAMIDRPARLDGVSAPV
jgi:hypothetical protein